jgi:hypothetical protein
MGDMILERTYCHQLDGTVEGDRFSLICQLRGIAMPNIMWQHHEIKETQI